MEPLLKVENLEKRYATGGLFYAKQAVTALAGVSLSLDRRTTLALVGKSGSGKSTLALCVAGLETPTSGSIQFDGYEFLGMNESQLRRLRPRIQLVFQDPANSLNPRFPVMDIVSEPLSVEGRLSRAQRKERVNEMLDRVAIPREKRTQRPDELSGGQRQRVTIARALVLNPTLLILDEALCALDCSIQAQIANLLADLQASLGLTYLFITHDFRMAAHFADEIAVMEQGRIVERGVPHLVFRRPTHETTRQMVAASQGLNPAVRLPGAP